jgi:CheY-like chemotaxis protein
MGHQVKSSKAVLPAFETIRKGEIDVILMDIMLPGLNGLSFTRKLKKYPEFRDIPIIAMTGHSRESMEANALRSGCDGFIEKPIDAASLEAALANAASGRKRPRKGGE